MRRHAAEWKVKRPNKNTPGGGTDDSQEGNGKTTVMLGHLPNTCTADTLIDLLDEKGFAKKYDFLYLPIDFQKHCNMGHAFINFHTAADAKGCIALFDGFTQWSCKSQKVCRTSYAVVQGYRANIKRQQKSSLVAEDTPEEFKPIVFNDEGERVPLQEVFKQLPAASAEPSGSSSRPPPESASWDSGRGWNDWWHDWSGWDEPGSSRDWYGYPDEAPTSGMRWSGGGRYDGYPDEDWEHWAGGRRGAAWECHRKGPGASSGSASDDGPLEEPDDDGPLAGQPVGREASAQQSGAHYGTSGHPWPFNPVLHASPAAPSDVGAARSGGQEFTGNGNGGREGRPPVAQQPETVHLNPGIRYACPTCATGFAKWSACFHHLSSNTDCRNKIPELDQESLQGRCKDKALAMT
mmetsp:Transcript_54711/g.123130  ORF Transcript_54711/g.123130 Transcript_54711/m.123130 type:complete len:407 (+) Transcript_54711:95-1315(+)|eukprot:CAMPEP_0197922822 /NCGR_PEP_ID=MMETSP1439-20131203/92934_1 /TAXON_ID=66791 /ORGANISM="Gonyaulax spinifera, Strain CCMP409" /LENGTH=406 /DNA_ID=CAMNT_0043545141 /DNA_START=91 /DNA_END=1311 /DNA_ORIENTATION=-